MRLTKLTTRNFIGARSVDLELKTPAVLIAGLNDAGKSATRESIVAALTGGTSRVKLKKDLSELITEGEKSGSVVVETDIGNATYEIPSGKWGDSMKWPSSVTPESLRYVLTPETFASMDTTQRRRCLFTLLKVDDSPETVEKMLLSRKIDAGMVSKIMSAVRARGMEEASKIAATESTLAKGQWREITGEAWGSAKGSDWSAPVEPYDAERHQQVITEIRDAKVAIDTLHQKIGALNASAGSDAKRKELEAQRDSLLSLKVDKEKELHKLRPVTVEADKTVEKLSADLANLNKPAAFSAGRTVDPLLAEILETVDSSEGIYDDDLQYAWDEIEWVDRLREVATATTPTNNAAEIDAYQLAERHLEEAKTAAANARAKETACLQAMQKAVKDRDQVVELLRNLPEQAADGDLDDAKSTVDRLKASLQGLESEKQILDKAFNSADSSEKATKRAAQINTAILAGIDLSKALAPDGISAELLSKALTPINDLLRDFATSSTWPQVAISDGMDISVGTRQYGLLSESGKWRADACIAMAIAYLSDVRYLMLDRIDVLSVPNRIKLITWVNSEIGQDTIDGAMLLGTFAAAPNGLPEKFTVKWLEDGRFVE